MVAGGPAGWAEGFGGVMGAGFFFGPAEAFAKEAIEFSRAVILPRRWEYSEAELAGAGQRVSQRGRMASMRGSSRNNLSDWQAADLRGSGSVSAEKRV